MQIGTQNRSNKLYIQAKKWPKTALIGEGHYVRAFWYRNFDQAVDPAKGVPAAWRYIIPADATPETTDWKRFLETAEHKNIPFERTLLPVAQLLGLLWRHLHRSVGAPDRHQELRRGKDRSHFLYGFGWYLPVGRRREDDREVPDTLSALYEYPDRFHLNYSSSSGTTSRVTVKSSWARKAPSR